MGISYPDFSYDETEEKRLKRTRPYEWGDAPQLARVKRATVTLAPGLMATLPTVCVIPDHEGMEVQLLLNMTPPGLRAVGVTVVRDGAPVTGQDLRAVRLAELVELALGIVMQPSREHDGHELPTLEGVASVPINFGDPDSPTERKNAMAAATKDEFLARIAAVYEAAALIGTPPQRYVMETYNAPRSTAGYWIREARKRGLLAPVKRSGGSSDEP